MNDAQQGIRDTEYTDNLDYFLEHAEEDQKDPAAFLKQYRRIAPPRRASIRWLDVGTGPGTKNITILQGLNGHEGLHSSHEVSMDVVEPSADWQRRLQENFDDAGLESVINAAYRTTWEEFKEQNTMSYDLATFFHSLYGIAPQSWSHIPEVLGEDGTGCVVVESETSDLHRIKQDVIPDGYDDNYFVSAQTVTDEFDKQGVAYSVSDDVDQRFYIDDLVGPRGRENIKPLSFIIQTAPDEYNDKLSTQRKERLHSLVQDMAKQDATGRWYLDTPDRFIWVH